MSKLNRALVEEVELSKVTDGNHKEDM
jgi:hypothetical protein